MCNGCHQFINLQNTPRPRHHSPPFMGLAERPGRTWSRICTRPIAIEPQSVVLIPSLRCAYNKKKNSTKRKKLRKFAKRSDMNFFLLFKKNEGATTVEPRLRQRLRPKSSTRDPVWGSGSGVSRGGCGSSWSASKKPRLSAAPTWSTAHSDSAVGFQASESGGTT